MLKEQEIIEGCKIGLATAQEALYNLYGRRLLGICRRYTKDKEEAEDIFHEALIKIFEKINTFQGNGSFEGWLKKITLNTTINHFKKRSRIITQSIDGPEGNNTLNIKSDEEEESFLEKVASTLSFEDLVSLINKLPDGYRMVFNLYAIEEYSHKEIGETFGISESTSRSQLLKARRTLKTLMLELNLVENARRVSK